MMRLWSRIRPLAQGLLLGYTIVFMIPPVLWVLVRWWRFFFPGVPA